MRVQVERPPSLPDPVQTDDRERKRRHPSGPTRAAVLGPHRLGAEPRDAAPQLPAHGDRQRGSAPGCHRRGARLGERRPRLLSAVRAHHDLDPGRTVGALARRAVLAEQRPDDALLLRGRPRGPPGVRHGRAAGAAAAGPAACSGPWRDDRAGLDLPRAECGPRLRARLGRRHVDGHGVRARDAGARRAALPGTAAGIHAHRLGGRRRHGAARDRDRLCERAARCPPC